jgi:uncharacterized protein
MLKMRLKLSGGKLTKRKNKIVIDTSVLIYAVVFGGIPQKAVTKALKETLIVISPPLLNEYRYVPLELFRKNKINNEQFKSLISGTAAFVSKAVVITPEKKLFVCRDPKYNMVLECCLEAGADILITGDKDLLEIENLSFKLRISTPSAYLKNRQFKLLFLLGQEPGGVS